MQRAFDWRYRVLSALLLAGLVPACGGGGGGSDALGGGGDSLVAFASSPALANPSSIPPGEVFELALTYPADFGPQGNYSDVEVAAVFVSPSGTSIPVGGFYDGTVTSGESIWRLRLLPREAGVWTYSFGFSVAKDGILETGTGSFERLPGDDPGFLRVNPQNPYRWQLENGEPFAPLGVNVCFSRPNSLELDGGDRFGAFRGDFQGRPPIDVYLATHAAAGFNVFRFSQANCSEGLVDASLTNYSPDVARDFDRMFRSLRANGFHVFFGLFGYLLGDRTTPPTPEELAFVEYCVNRWGAYTDIWELQNEAFSEVVWIDPVAAHLNGLDPYDHPVSTSWQQPISPGIDVNSPHWYASEGPLDSDLAIVNRTATWKPWAVKPVLVGETGNKGDAWDETSAERMRLRNWAAFFVETGLVYWDASWATNHSGLFVYIGPEERRQTQVLQRFSEAVLQSDTVEAPLSVSAPAEVRVFGLVSSETAAAYLHHYTSHEVPVTGLTLDVDVPVAGTGTWIDPESGRVLGTVGLAAGPNTLSVPEFVVDVAFHSEGVPREVAPLALLSLINPQDDGDADNDGAPNIGPPNQPFGVAPLTLDLDASDSYDPDGGAVSIEWDFGDGTPIDTLPATAHTFDHGLHFVTLTVTDDEGRAARQHFLVRATGDANPDSNDPPALSTIGLEDVCVREGEPLVITPMASDRELQGGSYLTGELFGEVLSYVATGVPAGSVFVGEEQNPDLVWTPGFDQSGVYEIDFQAVDVHGASSLVRRVIVTVLDSATE